jgi:LmbE family N-acetylglucosaminyl deacetylase
VAVIVAHPDDETLWAGGIILMYPEAEWTIVTLCRKKDPDRAPKFFKVCKVYGAHGAMADLDDGPEQTPLPENRVQNSIMQLLPSDRYDLIFTHGFFGEYTRHLRHEEVSRAVMVLHRARCLQACQVLCFAYGDDNRKQLPQVDDRADITIRLSNTIWQKKYKIITEIYGYSPDSWEARSTPKKEAFCEFASC